MKPEKETDSFRRHFDTDLDESEIENLTSKQSIIQKTLKFPALGDANFSRSTATNFQNVHISNTNVRCTDFAQPLQKNLDPSKLTPTQRDFLSIFNDYLDLYNVDTSFLRAQRCHEIRYAYCAHVLNHVLKSRRRIVKNNAKLRSISEEKSKKCELGENRLEESNDDEFRDQGLTRAKILILLPFRHTALTVVRTMIDLLFPDENDQKKKVTNKKRFFNEFSAEDEGKEKEKTDANFSKRPRFERPPDFDDTFKGNIDDCFRLGVSITKGGALKLYADFYSADIIIASPLGLRMVIGAEGEKEYDYDFLSSIELLILDRADIFLMQNWSHVLHIFQHLHRQPRESHGVDFSRVRTPILNGWTKFYRQTIIFSAVSTPEIKAIFNGHCFNYDGRVAVAKNANNEGGLAQVIVPLPHAFQRFSCDSAVEEADRRYEFFVNKILPQYTDSSMSGTLIFVPSYFDFVRLRNDFKKRGLSFVQICEYTSDKKVSRARDLFFHGDKHFLLYTERFHFYHRYRVRGVKNFIFYQLPTYAYFYAEMCNVLLEKKLEKNQRKNSAEDSVANSTCAVLFSKFDALKLAGVVGVDRATSMLQSDKNVHMLITTE